MLYCFRWDSIGSDTIGIGGWYTLLGSCVSCPLFTSSSNGPYLWNILDIHSKSNIGYSRTKGNVTGIGKLKNQDIHADCSRIRHGAYLQPAPCNFLAWRQVLWKKKFLENMYTVHYIAELIKGYFLLFYGLCEQHTDSVVIKSKRTPPM